MKLNNDRSLAGLGPCLGLSANVWNVPVVQPLERPQQSLVQLFGRWPVMQARQWNADNDGWHMGRMRCGVYVACCSDPRMPFIQA